tara:strand:+ start:433273 stop:433611 length:339 start_codon:yes stop_codon:yes gene_type:complete
MSDSQKKETARGMEAVVRNASVMNRSAISKVHFKEGDRIIISNQDYAAQELRIVDVQRSGGDVHVRLQGGSVDMVTEMSWLQREYATGKVARLDENGEIIKDDEKLSDGTGA